TSSSEAQEPLARLCGLVEKVLTTNQELSRRMRAMEDRVDTVGLSHNDDELSLASSEPHTQPTFAFEEDLLSSQVYRKPLFSRSGDSLIISAARSTTASVLSALSVADVKDISILAVPVYAHEISNSRRYTFGDFSPETASPPLPQESPGQSKPARRSLKAMLLRRSRTKTEGSESASAPKAEILGVPLAESIKYAKVAISLTNEHGETEIYGYVPTWIGKTVAFLKEN
ncbi:MAG: hypothetical protein Q9226_009444, partial [Calogaya cf. arnoldii]